MKCLRGIKRLFDRGHRTNPPRPTFRRVLNFERMEERLTLTTAAPLFTFENISNFEGGWITLGSDQVLIGNTRGVVDTDGLSSFEFSATFGTGPVLNYQNFQGADVDVSDQRGASLLSGGNRNESVLGGGLQQVIPIAPRDLNPPNQPDGGHIQIARLFDPTFEQHAGRESLEVLATTPDTEPRRGETKARIQEYAPAQGREMAFEVASTSPLAAKSGGRVSQFNDLGGLGEEDSEQTLPTSRSENTSDSQGARHDSAKQRATLVAARGEEIPAEKYPAVIMAAILRVDHEKPSNTGEDCHEAARDEVFAEWPKEKWRQRPSAIEAPQAPLAKDRERQMNPSVVLSGVALLSAGIHYARMHSRDSLKEIEQHVGRDG